LRISVAALLALALIAAGCCSRAAPITPDPEPAKDLTTGVIYQWKIQVAPWADSFSPVAPAYNVWADRVFAGGDSIASGSNYILPILITADGGGEPITIELVKTKHHPNGWTVDTATPPVPVTAIEVTKYHTDTPTRFWQVVVSANPFSGEGALHLVVPDVYTDGTPYLSKNYYKLNP